MSLLIPNMLRLSVERKLTRKMPNGLLTCLSMTLLLEALCHLLTFASFATSCKRYRFKLTCFKSSEKNRLQNCLTVSNIQLGNVVSDTFRQICSAILDKLLENPADTSFDLEPRFTKFERKLPDLRDAIDGYITPEQAGKLKVIKAHYENLESRKAELEELISCARRSYQQELTIFKLLLVSAVLSLPSESFPKSVPIWSFSFGETLVLRLG